MDPKGEVVGWTGRLGLVHIHYSVQNWKKNLPSTECREKASVLFGELMERKPKEEGHVYT